MRIKASFGAYRPAIGSAVAALLDLLPYGQAVQNESGHNILSLSENREIYYLHRMAGGMQGRGKYK